MTPSVILTKDNIPYVSKTTRRSEADLVKTLIQYAGYRYPVRIPVITTNAGLRSFTREELGL